MHSDKKLTKEDTWRPADLKRYIREEGKGGDIPRRRDESERKHRGGESTERRRRDPEKESRREREKHRERESSRGGRGEVEDNRYVDARKEGSRDRRSDKDRDRDRRDEKDREKRRERDKMVDGKRTDDDHRDRRRDREEKERHRDKEAEREKDRERRREERNKERRREERNKEHRSDRERRRHEEVREGERDAEREKRERHREKQRHNDEYEEKRVDRERWEKHGDRKHSELREEREHKDEHRRHKEERERRHKERGHQDEKRTRDSESRERRSLKGSDGEVRHHHGDRERAERDRHKERREREPEENHKEKDRNSSSKKPEKNNRHGPKTKEVAAVSVTQAGDSKEPVVDAEEQDEQEYEDDFEDYEEDFEDMDESANEDAEEEESQNPDEDEQKDELTAQRRKEIEAIKRAMEEENERVGTAQSRSSTSREEEAEEPKWSRESEKSQSRASHRGKFINFVAAKQREVSKKVASKQKKRSKELLRLIDLDFSVSVSLLDLPPVNEYDMYIRSFGNANTKQAYCQCNEDNTDRDIQTEEVEVCEKWTQHPSENSGDCGDPNLSHGARDKTTSELSFDSQRLTAFLHSASQVIVVLLEEAQAEKKSLRKLKSQTDALSFSDGSLQLNTKLPFLDGRHIRLVHFSQAQKHTLMSVHDPTSKPGAERLDSCTIICIWNIREPSRPQRILFYESEVLCCCFSPREATLVFAGTSVGSVVLWDLREQASNHQCMKIGENEWTLRQPTFSTDAVMAGSGHFSSVTSVEVVPSAAGWGLGPEVPLLASEEESSGSSFQLASLDDSGVLNFWVVVELPKPNDAGSPTDLGLRPGGKVKLLHSSLLLAAERVSPRDAVKTGAVQTLHLKFLPTDSNHFFIGTNMGLVNHGTSHGLKAPPKFYRSQEAGARPVEVTSISFSPFCSNLFLVGCADGSIRLHTVRQEQPVAQWTNGPAAEPVVSLLWTQTRPAVFCALDSASNLHIWDLIKSETEPVVREKIHSDRVTAASAFGDSGQQNTYSGIALAHESGKIEMQYFSRNLTVPVLAEEEKLESMMSDAF